MRQAEQCLADVRAVDQPSKLCRVSGRTALGVALRDGGLDQRLASRLSESVSADIKDIVLRRAVAVVVQALADMTSPQHQQQQQRSVSNNYADGV